MKFILLPAWAALALAGGIYAAPPVAAATPTVPSPPSAPNRPSALGLAQPIGSHVQLSWLPVSRAQAYKVFRDGQLLASSPTASWTDYAVAAGETHTYSVAGFNTAGSSQLSAAARATVPAGGGQVIYADRLENGWKSWSWANLASTSPVRAGNAIHVAAGPWQTLYLHHAPFSAAPYAAVTFWINGGSQGGQRLTVKALRGGAPQAAVSLAPLPAGRWQSVTIPLRSLGAAGARDLDGLWVQDASSKAQPAFSVDEIALTAASAASAATAPPAAPAGLSATPQWAASCPKCGGMAMPHIVLAWNAVPGTSSYTVYRGGVKVQDGLTSPGWTDMTVTSGQAYSYTVTATGPGGEGTPSVPATATAPNPPAGGVLTAPVNLTVQGVWQGLPTDALAWSSVPGAASYNVYQYGTLIAQGVTATSYTVPTSVFYGGMTYTITAVDSMGMETLPSAIATAQGSDSPAQAPNYIPPLPAVPVAVAAAPEWNAGGPRIHVTWQGNDSDTTYAIYRDGQKVADGLWGLNYYDQSVKPGETHTYAVSAMNMPWVTSVESLPSAAITAVAPSAASLATGTPVQITNVKANDDSALVSFAAVPGALDYRVYDVTKPNTVKYSGGSLSIEMNGLDPAGADLVVEAVDKLGPFQTMDGMTGPGAMQMDGMHSAINGQGDPSNIPIVLAASAPVHVTSQPLTLAGSQAFLDNFRNENPLVAQPLPALVPNTWYGDPNGFAEYQNDKWTVRDYGGDLKDTKVFFMGSHFMDTLYDGGTPGTSIPMHNNNATLVMMPKAIADISGGKVLHVTCEVDAHMDGRRWIEINVGAAGDTLVNPGKFADSAGLRPTLSGQYFRWQIQNTVHSLDLFPGTKPDAFTDAVHLLDQANGVGADDFDLCTRSGPWAQAVLPGGNGQAVANGGDVRCTFNGTAGDLDKRNKFDLYLSTNRVVIMEEGHLIKDVTFPDGLTLPFDKCQVYFGHQLYHTANDRSELLDYDKGLDPYWYNYRPWSDERHWDNMGQEVLPGFPMLP